MHTQNLVSLLLRQELDKAVSVEVGLCTRVGGKVEFADVVLGAGRLQVLLSLADPSHLGVGVDDGGDGSVVDVAVTALDVLNSGDALLLGLVRQHGSKSHVANALDVGHGGVELVVDNDTALAVDLTASSLEVQTLCEWPASDSDENDVGLELKGSEWGTRSR